MKSEFLTDSEQSALREWHSSLDKNRGDRARLRRAEAPEDILLTKEFFDFLGWMNTVSPQWSQDKRLLISACLVGVLSHVKSDMQGASFAEQLATPLKGKAPVSELRFEQLLKSPTLEDFYRRLIRVIRILDGNVNLISLANDIIHWHKEFNKPLGRHRDVSKRLAVRWATDYFTALTKN